MTAAEAGFHGSRPRFTASCSALCSTRCTVRTVVFDSEAGSNSGLPS
jgi:hypothetical protein